MNFDQRVWDIIERIPRGKVTTYKAIAAVLRNLGAARAVGNACNRNPNAPKVPCHRVVKSSGELGGYAGGSGKKARLLEKEGVTVKNGRISHFKDRLFVFP